MSLLNHAFFRKNISIFKIAKRFKAINPILPSSVPVIPNGGYLIKGPVLIKNLSCDINISEERIKQTLKFLGIPDTEISTLINPSVLELILDHYNISYKSANISPIKSSSLRPPILTIIGHVDHGKTTLLDYLRRSSIATSEIGGITQKISAFTGMTIFILVRINKFDKVCFVDTPGHSAFSQVRSRGVQITDLVVLVVAADSGVQEQTLECIRLIKAAMIPHIVCITKVDKFGKNITKVYDQLLNHEVELEYFGGKIPSFEVSAITGQGMKEFVEFLPKKAAELNLTYDADSNALGTIIDLRVSSSIGKIATCILKQGSLKRGDFISCQSAFAKVKQIILENGKLSDTVMASQPFHLVGWNATPIPGDIFHLIDSEKNKKELHKEYTKSNINIVERVFALNNASGKLFSVGVAKYTQFDENNRLHMNLYFKCDNYGSAEAIYNGIKRCIDPRVSLHVYCCGVEPFTTHAILSAPSQHTLFCLFNSDINQETHELLGKMKFTVHFFDIIYRLFDHIKEYMQKQVQEGMILKQLGTAKVLATFALSGKLKRDVIGMKVTEGMFLMEKNIIVQISRNNMLIHQDTMETMKQRKTVVTSVNFGDECGISISSKCHVLPGDIVTCYRILPDEKTINWPY